MVATWNTHTRAGRQRQKDIAQLLFSVARTDFLKSTITKLFTPGIFPRVPSVNNFPEVQIDRMNITPNTLQRFPLR
jgi:hypothetical protein